MNGSVVLVTGAARNIGRAIALQFASTGADIVLNARSSLDDLEEVAREVERVGARCLVQLADVRDREAVQRMVEEAERQLGNVTVLVNNAAIRNEAPFGKLEYSAWRAVIDSILDGAFHCTQAVLPGMLRQGQGSIINIAGLTGQTGAPHRAHVVTAKAGIIGFTKALALELAQTGVTVNAVSPGMIDTVRLTQSTVADPEHRKTRVVPMGRLGAPEDVAAACVYLASAGARFVTGQTLGVNGGSHLSS